MNGIILTQNSTPIFKYIVWVLGKVMDGIFTVLDLIGLPYVALAIFVFTIIVNLIMLPLTFKQQKFSKLQMKMAPELKAIQKKYEGRKDNESAMQQNAEMQALYAKYGTSPTGSCAYLLIQFPILIGLYRVIYAMPAYVTRIKEAFFPLVDDIINTSGAVEVVKNFSNSGYFTKQFDNPDYLLQNTIIDCLNRASTADFQSLKDGFASLGGSVDTTVALLEKYNRFININIGNTPWYIIKDAFTNGNSTIAMAIVALMIPVLAGATQWLSIKLNPTQPQSDPGSQAGNMESSMKTMNTMMPLISVWFCFTLPAGMGIYWVASAVVRSVIQVIMNKKIDSMDFDTLIGANSEKAQKKLEKRKAQQEKMNAYANMSTKNISSRSSYVNPSSGSADSSASTPSTPVKASPGSMMSKANMVKDFNEKNNR